MRDMTYIERDAFGRGSVPVETTQNSVQQRAESPTTSLFLRRFSQTFRGLLGLLSRKSTSCNANMNSNGNRDNANAQRKGNGDDDDDDVFGRDAAKRTDVEMSEQEEHISRDIFGRGNTSVLENAIINYNGSVPFSHSVVLQEDRLNQSVTNSTFRHSDLLSHELSHIFSSSSVKSDKIFDESHPISVKGPSDKNTVNLHENENMATPVSLNGCVTKQDPVPHNSKDPKYACETQRPENMLIETEEEINFERDPEMDYTGGAEELNWEMSLGSSCDDEFLTAL